MTSRTASCRCGQLRATCEGEPVRISVCHCLDCQQRSGSAFAAQARWPDERFTLEGDYTEWSRVSDSGSIGRFRFCPACGSTVVYVVTAMPGLNAVPVGAFADPDFPAPTYSVWEQRRHKWVEILGEDVEHFD